MRLAVHKLTPPPWAALTWYLASCASKEAGVILPLLVALEVPALLSHQRQQVCAALMRLAPLLAALPLFLLYRTWCLGTAVGFPLAGVGYLWVLLELVMLAMSPSPAHRYYLLEGGYALWIGGGLVIFANEFAFPPGKDLTADDTDKRR